MSFSSDEEEMLASIDPKATDDDIESDLLADESEDEEEEPEEEVKEEVKEIRTEPVSEEEEEEEEEKGADLMVTETEDISEDKKGLVSYEDDDEEEEEEEEEEDKGGSSEAAANSDVKKGGDEGDGDLVDLPEQCKSVVDISSSTDSSQKIKFEGHGGKLKPESSKACDSLSDLSNLLTDPLASSIDNLSHITKGSIKAQDSPVNTKHTRPKFKKEGSFEACIYISKGSKKGRGGSMVHLNENRAIAANNSNHVVDKDVMTATLEKEKNEQIDAQPREGVKLGILSSTPAKRRARSSSPVSENEERNKKPAIMCKLFLEGLCSNGSKCKFLHEKNSPKSMLKSFNGELGVESSKGELQEDAGLRSLKDVHTENPTMNSTEKWPSKLSSHELPHKSTPGEEQNQSLQDPLFNDERNPYSRLKSNDEFIGGYPLTRNNSSHDYRYLPSSSNITPSSNGGSSGFFLDKKNSCSLDPLVSHTSASFNGNSNFNSLGALKPYDSDRRFPSRFSMPRSSSSPYYSRYEHENMFMRGNLGASVGSGTKFVKYNWETSVPFRPSFTLSSIMSSRIKYDSLRNSVKPPSKSGESLETNGSSALLHKKSQDNLLAEKQPNDIIDTNKNMAEVSVSKVTDRPNRGAMRKEDEKLKPSNVVDVADLNGNGTEPNLGHPKDGAKNNKESKYVKLFRASLVEFVKEVVKPSWREGLLTKDAHNMIVKRVVERVLAAFLPHQIPTSLESSEEFLSTSRHKITKLVQGYVVKHGKPTGGAA